MSEKFKKQSKLKGVKICPKTQKPCNCSEKGRECHCHEQNK